jgi:hypothetical protein
MVSEISVTAQLIPKFNYAQETSGEQYVPNFIEMRFEMTFFYFLWKILYTE